MKILSDFDGVMTELEGEAAWELALFTEQLGPDDEALSPSVLLERVFAELRRNPHRYGWSSKGRLTGYCDEDLFIRNIAAAELLDTWAAQQRERCVELRERIGRAGYASFFELLVWAHDQTMRRSQAGELPAIVPEVAETLRKLLDQGHELVVVSNSGTARVMQLLSSVGLEPMAHEAAPQARLRVRGGARKFELGLDPELVDFGPRVVDVARPRYLSILEEEKPDVVLGDVFSFDLALPLHLGRMDRRFSSNMKVLLRLREYSPGWLEGLAHEPGFGTLHELSELLQIGA